MIANSQALGEEPGMDIHGMYCTCTHFFWQYLQELDFHDHFSMEHSFLIKETKSSHSSKDFNCDLLAPTHVVRVLAIEVLNSAEYAYWRQLYE